MSDFTPTKTNLINAKTSLEFSEKAFELLDKKRSVLIREMMNLIERAKDIQNNIEKSFSEAYKGLQVANITMGINTVENISLSISEENEFIVLLKSVMGIEIPMVKYTVKPLEPQFSFYRTNNAMDIAFKHFQEVKYHIFILAEIETSIYKLAMEIKKTQKRTNALQNIQIPRYKELVKSIQEALEEKEREDFFRLKIVKKKGANKIS